MQRELSSVHSNLIDKLEGLRNPNPEDKPFYWYNRLDEVGKPSQTEELISKAVTNFTAYHPTFPILKLVAKKYLTRDICEIAVSRNGFNLKYVPEQLRDRNMCLKAVKNTGEALADVPPSVLNSRGGRVVCMTAAQNDLSGEILKYVPDRLLQGDEGKALIEIAVETNGYAIEFVPKRRMSKKLAQLAFRNPLPYREVQYPDGSKRRIGPSKHHSILSTIPDKYLSSDLVAMSAHLYPSSLPDAPKEYVSRNLYIELLRTDPTNLQYIQQPDNELIHFALNLSPSAIKYVPKSMLTTEMCREALREDPNIPLDVLPIDILENLEEERFFKPFIEYEPFQLELPSSNTDINCFSLSTSSDIYDLTTASGPEQTICYISDIHIEHQIAHCRACTPEATPNSDISQMTQREIKRRLERKVDELIESAPDACKILLIGGDVADSVKLEALFFDLLVSHCYAKWEIFTVLGNHELWNGDPSHPAASTSIETTIEEYRNAIPPEITLLENQLYLRYKGTVKTILSEQEILEASVDELTEVCSKSTFLLLGGLGFSGYSNMDGTDKLLYGKSVSGDEINYRIRRFHAVYDKVLTCAHELRVVVLTHIKFSDLNSGLYNPNWIYVNGHTHRNELLVREDGLAVLSDNQIGYKPKPWALKAFNLDIRRYDPMENCPDGIYSISKEYYCDFMRCQGIHMEGTRHPGTISALKRNGVYMFVKQHNNSLCLLEGGRPHKLDHPISYYYENLPEYVSRVRRAMAPFQKALCMISGEVKLIGGLGTIHGCIIDIDHLNHIYLNPFDGKITPYFALDMTRQQVFDSIQALLQLSPYPPQSSRGQSISTKYSELANQGKLRILSPIESDNMHVSPIPQVVFGQSIYNSSRIMRSVQYVLDGCVLRIWKDAVLSLDDPRNGLKQSHFNSFPGKFDNPQDRPI